MLGKYIEFLLGTPCAFLFSRAYELVGVYAFRLLISTKAPEVLLLIAVSGYGFFVNPSSALSASIGIMYTTVFDWSEDMSLIDCSVRR